MPLPTTMLRFDAFIVAVALILIVAVTIVRFGERRTERPQLPAWPAERPMTGRARAAVQQAEHRLREEFGDLVDSTVWDGAVDADPRTLVVWVLLHGDPQKLPARCFDPENTDGLGADLRQALAGMRAVVREQLAEAEWPGAAEVRVGFDAAERVRASGGFVYLK